MRIGFIVLVIALGAGAAQAQAPGGAGCPAGTQAWVVRTSKIKPGQDATFKKALVDQQAWYRAKGLMADGFKVGPLMSKQGVEPGMMVAVHMNAPASRPTNDAAWDAFVGEFRASSDIVSETYTCLGDVGR